MARTLLISALERGRPFAGLQSLLLFKKLPVNEDIQRSWCWNIEYINIVTCLLVALWPPLSQGLPFGLACKAEICGQTAAGRCRFCSVCTKSAVKEFLTTQWVFYENSAVCHQNAVWLRDVKSQWPNWWFTHLGWCVKGTQNHHTLSHGKSERSERCGGFLWVKKDNAEQTWGGWWK